MSCSGRSVPQLTNSAAYRCTDVNAHCRNDSSFVEPTGFACLEMWLSTPVHDSSQTPAASPRIPPRSTRMPQGGDAEGQRRSKYPGGCLGCESIKHSHDHVVTPADSLSPASQRVESFPQLGGFAYDNRGALLAVSTLRERVHGMGQRNVRSLAATQQVLLLRGDA